MYNIFLQIKFKLTVRKVQSPINTKKYPPDKGVAVTAVDPGFTDTNLTRNLAMMKSITRFLVYPIFWPVMKRARTGAQVNPTIFVKVYEDY